VKLLAYRVFDPTAAPLLTEKPVDATSRAAKRVHAFHELRKHRKNHKEA